MAFLQLGQRPVHNIQSKVSLGALPVANPTEISGRHDVLFPCSRFAIINLCIWKSPVLNVRFRVNCRTVVSFKFQ
jgi:hypothetical protein